MAGHGRARTLPEGVQCAMQKDEVRFIGKKSWSACASWKISVDTRSPETGADELSARELEVAQRFAAGSDYKTIAQELSGLSFNDQGAFEIISTTSWGINEKSQPCR